MNNIQLGTSTDSNNVRRVNGDYTIVHNTLLGATNIIWAIVNGEDAAKPTFPGAVKLPNDYGYGAPGNWNWFTQTTEESGYFDVPAPLAAQVQTIWVSYVDTDEVEFHSQDMNLYDTL